MLFFFFFFQAEDGIRDKLVTGVQTCALPIYFVTGGGWITGPSGARANFGVAGGMKNGGLWGHLTYVDHGPSGFKVKGTSVTSYEVMGPTWRRIKGIAEVDGVSGIGYTVDVTDAGEPGRMTRSRSRCRL